MTKKWMAINLLLLAIAGLLGWRLYASLERFRSENNLEKVQPIRDVKKKIIREKSSPETSSARNYLPAEFEIIAEKNLFSDTRSRDEQVEDVIEPQNPPLTQKPFLVGVIFKGSEKTALIVDPAVSPQNKVRPTKTRRVGDVYRGYTITSIESDHIVLESGGRKEIIPLHEGSKGKQAGKTPILSTRVVSFGGGAVSGGKVIAASPRRAGSAASPATVAIGNINVSPSAAVPVAVSSSGPAAKASAAASSQAQPPAPPATTKQLSTTPDSGSQRTRVIRTPFGDIIRPVRD